MSIQLYAPVVALPYDLAVMYAAEQNFSSDVRRKIVSGEDRWEYLKASYIEEAEELLQEDLQNYHPEFDDLPHIRIANIGKQFHQTRRSCVLLRLIDYYYKHQHLLKLVKPSPHEMVTVAQIENHLAALQRKVSRRMAH